MNDAVNYLRISAIDRCNFRCQYCMPGDGDIEWLPHANVLSDAELLRLIECVFVPLGFDRFRLTGGEPLLRRGMVELVRKLCALPGVVDVAMTTNAYALADKARSLYDSGLRRINISLDSLDPQTFYRMTGRDAWHRVWAGVQAAHAIGFTPLKLNVVAVPGINDGDIEALAALTLERAWQVRFIEFMPIGNAELFGEKSWIDSAELRRRIQDRFGLELDAVAPGTIQGNGPADVFRIPGALGTLGFISQMSECFCDRCNRMRLSADGWLRPCLLNESGQVDLRTMLRGGASDVELRQQVRQVLAAKPDISFKERDRGTSGDYARTMSQIGG